MGRARQAQRVLVIGLVVIALLVVPVFMSMIGRGSLAAPFVYGGAIAVTAAFRSIRLAVVLSLVSGLIGAVATLTSPHPIAGAVYFGTITGLSAFVGARRGALGAFLMVPIFMSFMLAGPPDVADLGYPAASAAVGIVIAAGGLWAAGAMKVIVGDPRTPTHVDHIGDRQAIVYAIALGVLIAGAAWAVLTWARFHEGAWLLLTLIIVLQPSAHDTVIRSLQRLAGTVVGGLVALLLILLGLQSTAALIVGGVALFAAFTLRYALHRPYWEYVSVLTPAAILLNAQSWDERTVAEERIGFTLAAAVVAVLAALLIKLVAARWAPAREPA